MQLHDQGSSIRSLSIRSSWLLRSLLALTLTVLLGCTATADTHEPVLEFLSPTDDHEDATEVIVHLMKRYHYSQVPVNNELSDQIFDRFFDSLDPQKSFFLASDVEEFSDYRYKFDDALKKEKLGPVFDIFNRYRTRVTERSQFAQERLTNAFDFTIDESYAFNREEAEWPTNKKAMDELWRKRVKNDVLSLRLAEQSDEDLKKTLQDRYERMGRRITQLSANDVFQLFINAYTLSVEPHTSYFSPRSSEDFKINMSLSLEGIGAALNTQGEFTVIQRLITGGPASLSDELSVKDRIVGVGQGEKKDIVDVVSWPLADVVDLIRGPKGSTVRLKILPANEPNGGATSVVTLIRDKIKLEEQAAKSSVVDVERDGITQRFGVIDLPTFYLDSTAMSQGQEDYRSTTRDVKRLINELTESEEGVDGIIVDLRGNGGGSLIEATQLTGLFIESGPVVQIRNANGKIDAEVDTDPSVTYDGPLAVLVDRNSASASEIFAAAIQDYGRGVVLGEPTFGKGTVQTVAPLDRSGKLGQLKITIAQFFRVNGDSTQHTGVIPDVLFPIALDSDAQGERGLDNALPWAEVKAAKFDAWTTLTSDFDSLQSKHESRYKANESFALLIEELEAQRESRAKKTISLLESARKQEALERKDGQDVREELYRKAFGASSRDDDNETEDGEEKTVVTDIILEEAANVLLDVIESPPIKR